MLILVLLGYHFYYMCCTTRHMLLILRIHCIFFVCSSSRETLIGPVFFVVHIRLLGQPFLLTHVYSSEIGVGRLQWGNWFGSHMIISRITKIVLCR